MVSNRDAQLRVLLPSGGQGALSQRWGVRGFEIGFEIMAAAYALGAALMAFSFFFTFNKNRVTE